MTAADPKCLTPDDLRNVTSGNLAAEELTRAEAHLAACERCVDQLSRLVDADRLAPLLRAAAASPVFLDSHAGELARQIAAGLETRIASGDATHINPALNADVDLSWDAHDEVDFRPAAIGPFRVIRLLGRGGMGAVFEAEDQRLMRRVALKVILPQLAADASLRDRFLREARSIAAIRHPAIVGIYEVGSDADVPYLAMELLTGQSLDTLVAKTAPLPAEQVAAIGAECAAGLAAVHAKGLLHRDIKPGNIWIESLTEEYGSTTARIKLLDFGLARPAQDSDGLTRPGVVIGTPRYLSPEQARGDVLDARSDLFGLGCVLYQLATGKTAFDGPDVLSRLNALATTVPQRADSLNPQVPAELADLIDRLLARDVAQRPDSATTVAHELRRIAARLRRLPSPPVPQVSPGASGTGRRRRNLIAWLSGGFAAAVLLAVIIIIKFQDGSTLELKTDKAVQGVTYQNPGQPPVQVDTGEQPSSSAAVAPAPTESLVPATRSFAIHSLDHLDPQLIPESERIAGQPSELVAVLGEQAMREWFVAVALVFDDTGHNLHPVLSGGLPTHSWSTQSFSPVAIFPAHETVWEYPTFTRDGRHAFSVDRLWDAAEGANAGARFDRSRPFPDVDPSCGDFSPDGHWLVTAVHGADQLQLWDLSADTLQPVNVAPLLEKDLASRRLTVVDDPPRIVLSMFNHADGPTDVYDVNWEAVPVPRVSEPIRLPHKTLIARNAPRGLSIHSDGAVQMLDVSNNEPRVIADLFPPRWPAASHPIIGDVSADGRTIVAPMGGNIPIFRENDGIWRQSDLLQVNAGVTAARLSSDGSRLAVAEADYFISVWDVSQVPAVALRSAPMATRIDRLTISPDGRYAGVAGMDGRAVYDLTSQVPRQVDGLTISGRHDGLWTFNVDPPLAGFTAGHVHDLRQTPAIPISRPLPVADVAFVPGRSELLLWNPPTGDVHLTWTPWRIDQRGTLLLDSPRDTTTIPPLFIDPSEIRWDRGRFLATDSSSGMLRVYDFDHPEAPLATLQGRPFQNRWQCLSASGELALQWMIGQDAIVWDLTTSPPTEYRVPVHSTAGAFAPNEKYIILDAQDGGMVVYDWQLNREVHRIPLPGPVRSIYPHPDGRHALTVNGNGTVYILRLPDELAYPVAANP